MKKIHPCEKALIDQLAPSGEVLEIGFGPSSLHIQTYQPKSHTIIEHDPLLAKEAKKMPNVIVIQDTWQNALSNLGIFDTIIVSGYPLEKEEELPSLLKHVSVAKPLLEKEQEIAGMVSETLPDLKTLTYSDQDIDAFCSLIAQTQPKEAAQFLDDLKADGQITLEQYERALSKHHLLTKGAESVLVDFWKHSDHLLLFLTTSLKSHLNKGGKIACLLHEAISKYDDHQFFEHIITNSTLTYEEKPISIDGKIATALMMIVGFA